MNIQNFSSMSADDQYIKNQYQDFSSKPVNENSNISASHVDIDKNQEREDGDTLSITKESSVAAKRLEVPRETITSFGSGTDFSTKTSNDMETSGSNAEQNNSQNNNDVLNQYRFFVQSYQYQDTDGAVRRIFR